MHLFFHCCLLICLLLLPRVSGAETATSSSVTMPDKHRSIMKQYCFDCHDSETREGKVDLESLPMSLGTIESAESWQKILGVMNAGEMPPKDEPQLTAAEKTEFLDDLSHRLVMARKVLSDDGGVVTMRRLNRREYVNTIRDLLGVELSANDLPDDSNSGGFDTAGSSLYISSDQIEKYLQLGRAAIDMAWMKSMAVSPVVQRRQPEKEANKSIRSRYEKLFKSHELAQAYRASDQPPTAFGFIDESRVEFEEGQYRRQSPPLQHYLQMSETADGVVLHTTFAGAHLDVTRIPNELPAGDYLFRVCVGALQGSSQEDRFLEYGRLQDGARTGEMSVLGCRYVQGTRERPEVIEIRLSFPGAKDRHFALRERGQNNRDAARREYTEALADGQPMPRPSLWIDWVEWEGPIADDSGFSAREQILGVDETSKVSEEDVRQILERFARRAFRSKHPAPAYIDRLVELFHDRRADGESFEEAIKEPLSVILASPSFLYLCEPNDSAARRKLTDQELAVRLSYFLWSAPPDAELQRIADQGDLSDPDVLAEQTERMLDSPRVSEFVRGFTHQWLSMERLDFFQFNATRFPKFDDSVKAASRFEVYQTIETLIHEGLSIRHLLDSKFVVINDLLASYYGIDAVRGHEFRKVAVPEGTPRGGLLGMAAVLAMGSDGERSSPVERGAWVMRKLLNDPPPPAPANVPQLSRLDGTALSARELQKAHQEEPQCAQCHRKIDPIGFGLENFDAAGQWRDVEQIKVPVAARQKRGGAKSIDRIVSIDPSGTLPDGTAFTDFDSLRDVVAQRDTELATGFTVALIEYGLGRAYGFTDAEFAQQIVAEAKLDDFAIRSFIRTLVQSSQFQSK